MDPSSLGNLLGQETIKQVYQDALSEPTKEASKIATDVVKAVRLFTAPVQLLAAWQERFGRYCKNIADAVPEENQIVCPPSIAGPVFEKLKYVEDGNYLRELYLNLLKRGIDKERVNEAHPAFVTIIEQLSPDEALILKLIEENRFKYELRINTVIEIGDIPKETIIANSFPLDQLTFPQNYVMYIDHLRYLNLIDTPQYNIGKPDESIDTRPVVVWRYLQSSQFGKMFYTACIQ